jgi:hypothetical protein
MDWGLVVLSVGIALLVVGSYVGMKARLARLEHKLNLLLRHSGIDLLQGLPLSERVKEMARDPARKIEAIKIDREETGTGLAEAKEAVEAYLNSQRHAEPGVAADRGP